MSNNHLMYNVSISLILQLMDHLIDSEKDVSLLRQKGIIENWMGEDKEVASLFNKIGNGVTTYSDFHYKEECLKASEHCRTRWNRMKANLRHSYFNSPWKGASIVAAITLSSYSQLYRLF